MADILTYDSLQQDVRNYIERGDPSDTTVYEQIPRLIALAERDIARAIKIQGFIAVVTTTLSPGQSVYAKPDRWRDTVSMNYGAGVAQVRTPIFPRSYEYLRTYWPDEYVTDVPKFYADYGYYNWLILPAPSVDTPLEISYYELPALLSETNQTNWLTRYAWNALLHGTLVQATPFLKEDQRIPVWQAQYDRDLQLLNGEDLQKIIDRSTSRQEA
jgi:hypothetical protein